MIGTTDRALRARWAGALRALSEEAQHTRSQSHSRRGAMRSLDSSRRRKSFRLSRRRMGTLTTATSREVKSARALPWLEAGVHDVAGVLGGEHRYRSGRIGFRASRAWSTDGERDGQTRTMTDVVHLGSPSVVPMAWPSHSASTSNRCVCVRSSGAAGIRVSKPLTAAPPWGPLVRRLAVP